MSRGEVSNVVKFDRATGGRFAKQNGQLDVDKVAAWQAERHPPLNVTGKVDNDTVALATGAKLAAKPLQKAIIRVTGEGSTDPIANATVQVADQSDTTGKTGHAIFSLPPGTFPYSVTADGYQNVSGSIEVTNDVETTLHVELKGGGSGAAGAVVVTVTGLISEKPVKDATVLIGKGKPDKTDGDGKVLIGTELGKHPYWIMAPGYELASGNVDVTSTDAVKLAVKLITARSPQPPSAKTGQLAIAVVASVAGKDEKIPGAEVWLIPLVPTDDRRGARDATGSDGTANFDVPAGKYKISVTALWNGEQKTATDEDDRSRKVAGTNDLDSFRQSGSGNWEAVGDRLRERQQQPYSKGDRST
jgi:hypothetical protein